MAPQARQDLSAYLLDRVRAAPYAALAVGVLAVAAYLCLANLDYAALWHDEAPAALIGRNLLQRGDITGWDGRNLVGGTNGRTLNENLRDVLPPLTYVFNAAGMAVFGVNEAGARIMPALIGILSLALLALLLRQHLAGHPRLILFCLLFAAWSPQLLLYFRQSRYFAFMAFGVVAVFFLYERWWRSGSGIDLAALTLVAALAFFNHYTGGAATMLALAAWHLLLRARHTTPRQWLALACCGALVVAAGAAYLAWIGVIGGERSGFLAFTGVVGMEEYRGRTPPALLRLPIYARDLFAADWISWPVLLWFAGMLSAPLFPLLPLFPQLPLFPLIRRRRGVGPSGHRDPRGRRDPHGAPPDRRSAPGRDDLPVAAAGRVVLMGALFALFSAALSVQPVWALSKPYTDLRYYMGALPLLLAMKGLFVEWAWRRWRIAGAAAGAVLLFSSAGAWPFNMPMLFTGERTLGLHLFQLVREIHRPYHDAIRVVSDHLLAHAGQDDLVYVAGFADREALVFTTGHRVLFCCVLDEDSPLPRAAIDALDAHVSGGTPTPDWIILFGKPRPEYWQSATAHYAVAAQPDVYYYPTQRPEINLHAFTPLPAGQLGVHILRRSRTGALLREGDALRNEERHEEALQSYREVLVTDPEHALAHARVGVTLFLLQRYEEALQALAQAISLQPDLPGAGALHHLMGRAAQELGRPAAAEHFERALQLDPHDADTIDRLAKIRFEQRRYEDALALYRRLADLFADDAQTHANVGATLYYLGRSEDALRSFERALALDPDLEAARTGVRALGRGHAPAGAGGES